MLEHSDVSELAVSLKEQGIINPIEIDESGMIITGALRWMASKKAGFKTIPCRILKDLTPNEKFMRQLVENLQRNEMCAEDTANAVLKLSQSGMSEREIAEKIGKSNRWVDHQLEFCKVDDSLKEAVASGNIPLSSAIELGATPRRIQQKAVKKITKNAGQEKLPRYLVRDMATAIKEHPNKADKILELDFKDPAISTKLHRVAPPKAFLKAQNREVGDGYIRLTRDLLKFTQRHSPAEIVPMYKRIARSNTHDLIKVLGEWTKDL